MRTHFINWTKPHDIAGICTAVRHHKGVWALAISHDTIDNVQDNYVWEALITKCSTILGIKGISSSVYGGILFFKSEEQLNRVFKIFSLPIIRSSGIIARKFNQQAELVGEN